MKRYNIAPADHPAQWYTSDQIKAAADIRDHRLQYHVGFKFESIPCKLAAVVAGWCTAVSKNGIIIQAWAGDFTAIVEEAQINV